MAKRPEVLLCDEPTGGLDYATGKLVLEVIERVNEEFGTTTAIITHNAGFAKDVAMDTAQNLVRTLRLVSRTALRAAAQKLIKRRALQNQISCFGHWQLTIRPSILDAQTSVNRPLRVVKPEQLRA